MFCNTSIKMGNRDFEMIHSGENMSTTHGGHGGQP